MHATTRKLSIREMTADECAGLLERNVVGRIAFLNHTMVDIEPVHYVMDDGWLFVRTSEGSKLHALGHAPYVAFEVDEIEGPTRWRSAVVHGTVYRIEATPPQLARQTFQRALERLRTLEPAMLTEDDPAPFRQAIIGVHVDSITGREAGGARPHAPRRTAARTIERPVTRTATARRGRKT